MPSNKDPHMTALQTPTPYTPRYGQWWLMCVQSCHVQSCVAGLWNLCVYFVQLCGRPIVAGSCSQHMYVCVLLDMSCCWNFYIQLLGYGHTTWTECLCGCLYFTHCHEVLMWPVTRGNEDVLVWPVTRGSDGVLMWQWLEVVMSFSFDQWLEVVMKFLCGSD